MGYSENARRSTTGAPNLKTFKGLGRASLHVGLAIRHRPVPQDPVMSAAESAGIDGGIGAVWLDWLHKHGDKQKSWFAHVCLEF